MTTTEHSVSVPRDLTKADIGAFVIYDDGIHWTEVGRIKSFDNSTQTAYVVYHADGKLDTEEWTRYTSQATHYSNLSWRDPR